MRKRKSILEDNLALNGDLKNLKNELSSYPWDSDEEIVTISIIDLSKVFKKFEHKEISDNILCERANSIEGRDDYGYDTISTKEAVHDIANYEMNNIVLKDYIDNYLSRQ